MAALTSSVAVRRTHALSALLFMPTVCLCDVHYSTARSAPPIAQLPTPLCVQVIAQASRPAQQARSAAVASVSPKNAFGARAQAVLPSKKRGTAAYRGRSLVVKANNAAAPTKVTIVDAAIADPQFSVLVEAVVKAQLATALSGGSFTVFAPTNDAFTKARAAERVAFSLTTSLPFQRLASPFCVGRASDRADFYDAVSPR